MNTRTEEQKNMVKEIRLQKACIDPLSTKIQVFFASVITTVFLIFLYQPSMQAGFLLDDFLHLDYVARAIDRGDAHDFLANLYSNWGGSDLMKSYRPMVSLSIFMDYLLWKTNAFGYHLGNVLMTAGCAIFVALIASEASGNFGNRMRATTALWSALLFAAYPLHVESVSWIIGRVDLLATLFYLASLYFFMRLRLVKERLYFVFCIVFFVLSLASKEIAVTLPVVATLYALLIPEQQLDLTKSNSKSRFAKILARPSAIQTKALLSLWVALFAFAALRSMLIGSTIGGYGSDFSFSSALSLFTNQGTWQRVLSPINTEMLSPQRIMKFAHIPLYAALFFASIRCIFTPALFRLYFFFGAWTLIAILPAFQVFHIAENLAGSRLFFLSSAPYCLFLTFALLPADDIFPKKIIRLLAVIGTILLAYNFVFWSIGCHINQVPFQKAGHGMQRMQAQLAQIVEALPDSPTKISNQTENEDRILLLNLPSDYLGAPMITRPGYLKTMLSKPFSAKNYSEKIITAEPEIPCDHRFFRQEKLIDSIYVNPVRHVYMWSDADERVLPWSAPRGDVEFKVDLADAKQLLYEPKTTRLENGEVWHIFNEKYPQVEKFPKKLRLFSGLRDPKGLIVRIPIDPVNPLAIPLIRIKMVIHADQPVENLIPLVRLSFQQERNVVNSDKQAKLLRVGETEFECPLISNKEWLLGGSVKEIGLKILPCPFFIDLKSIEGVSGPKCVPFLSKVPADKQSDSVQLKVEVSKIPNAVSSVILVSKAGTTFDTNIEEQILLPYRTVHVLANSTPAASSSVHIGDEWLKNKVLDTIVISDKADTFKLPSSVYNDSGVHQVVALALDKNGKVLGLPSPVLKVEKQGGHR